MKTYRRFIRVGSRLIASPKFPRKSDAEAWYNQMLTKKHFERNDLQAPRDKNEITVIQYSRKWLDRREEDYPAATVSSDEQRLRDYVLPILAEYPLSKVKSEQIRGLLEKISRVGFRRKDFRISEGTRTRVKALLSAMFGDAMNETPPLIRVNPVIGIQLKEKRRGRKRPSVLPNSEACLKFLEAAQKIGPQEFVVAAVILMSGLRKQEMIALRWRCVDLETATLYVKEKYEQASNSIIPGTKAGENTTREIPISAELVRILTEYKAKAPLVGPEYFVISRADGRFLNAKTVSNMIEAVKAKSELSVTVHGLRHTYGREFALRTGNMKALQAILGHSSSSTTDIYSDLAGERTRGFNESVSFKIGVESSED